MPTATDLVDRQFSRDASDELWVTDITEHPTREGKVYYFCCVLDAYSRRVVGWSNDSSPTATLVTNAFGWRSTPAPDPGALIHSDHGRQFTSWVFTERAKRSGLLPSMGTITGPVDLDIQPGESTNVDVSHATEPTGDTFFLQLQVPPRDERVPVG